MLRGGDRYVETERTTFERRTVYFCEPGLYYESIEFILPRRINTARREGKPMYKAEAWGTA